MYTQTWGKYLPILKILIKRSTKSDQLFNLNSTDFKPASTAKKSGHTFSLHFRHGLVVNKVNTSNLAKDLAIVLTEDPEIKSLLSGGDFMFNMNTKHQLSIKQVPELKSA